MAFGLHYSDTLAGRVYSQGATPLGLAIPIYTTTAIAGSMPLWNPPGSNRNVELISADFGTASGTAVYGVIGLMVGQLNSIGTATGCSALAATVPQSGLLMGTANSRTVSSNAGTVTVTAGVATPPVAGVVGAGWTRSLAEINGEAAAAGLHGPLIPTYWFNGTVIVPPGVLIYFACTLASVALIATALVWKEIPINPNAG